MADDRSGLIGQVLGYIDKPWKAAVIVLLLVVGGAGYALYEKRDVILEAWLTPSAAGLKTDDIPDALEKLSADTGADLVQIWSVDLPSNSQTFIAARRSNGERPVIPNPRRLPVIVTVSDVQTLVDVMAGHPVCLPVTEHGSPLARRLAARGMKWGCAIPIPPSPDSFVGVIYLAWQERPEQSISDLAVGVARQIAGTLATR
jgi:hypothetical protein